jgi:NitT/TauT family transport system substrate-binding protein
MGNENLMSARTWRNVLVLAILLCLPMACARKRQAARELRLGCFANVTHAQALMGRGNGAFAKEVGVPVTFRIFNAGPTEMEALLAGELDVAYVGPNPAVNAWLRSGRKGLRIIAGSVSGGASLVVHPRAGIRQASDFRGKRMASPELGNTQDVALRAWLRAQGMEPGRDVKVMPIKNPEILQLFIQGELDAAWVPEPWATRLIQEAGGRRFLDEAELWPGGQFATTVVVAREAWLRDNPDRARAFLRAHEALTERIQAHPTEAAKEVKAELEKIYKSPLRSELLAEAFRFLRFTDDPLPDTLKTSAERAWQLGFLPSRPERMEELVDLRLLQQVKAERRSGVGHP